MSDEKIKVGFEGSDFGVAYDGNADGQHSVKISLKLAEVIDELKNKAGEGATGKPVTLSMEGTKVVVKGDLNKDGESFLEIEVDLLEGLDEAGVV